MERKISFTAAGGYLTKDSTFAGIVGEGGATTLVLSFDESWAGLTKTVTFYDAQGLNPVAVLLTVNHMQDNEGLSYAIPIPSEPLATVGEMSFVVDGVADGKRQRAFTDHLEVKYAPAVTDGASPASPTASEAEQLQAEIDAMLGQFLAYRDAAAGSAAAAASSASASQQSAASSANSAAAALGYLTETKAARDGAAASAAQAALSETAATASASAAQASETNASASASSATASASAAAASESAAETAQLASESARDTAVSAKTAAAASETNAAISATDASESAAAAAASEANAAISASAAQASETNAAGSAAASEASETAAQAAQTKAENAEASAISAKTAAESARDTAVSSASAASESETSAAASESHAAASAAAAQTSENNASASASAAQASETSAGNSATAAASSESSASASATASQSWTEGGTGTREGENTNNARYWSQQAQNAAAGGVTSFNGRAGIVMPQSGDYTAELVGADPTGSAAAAQTEAEGYADAQISAHDTAFDTHADIRTLIQTNATSAATAQQTADAALDAITRVAHTIDATPTQNGSLIYTGSAQSPSWNSYNPETLSIGGTTAGTDAGTYTATFTPKEGYTWGDRTDTPRSVTWTIGRAFTSALPSQSGSLTYTGSAQSPGWSGYDSARLTIGGDTSESDAGTYTAAFTPTGNYKWIDGTITARFVTWTIGRAAISTVPSQSGGLTYTGSAQSPSWSNYSGAQLSIGGDTSATNAGTYTATFIPTGNYTWSDGTTTSRSATWTIGKAAGSLSIDKTTMTLTNGALTGTITVTRAGDCAITAQSSNTGIATVSVSGNIVTVTGVAYGTAAITVSVAAGSNYTAPASKTCSATAKIYSTTLNSNTWAQIREVSDAGTGANYWSVGDTKAITINGTVGNTTLSNLSIDVFILGFNHNSSLEGANRIHFQIGKISGTPVALIDVRYGTDVSETAGYFSMVLYSNNVGGWKSSQMRTTILGNGGTPASPTANTLLAALSSDLLAVMKSCTKYSDNTGGGENRANYVTSSTDYLFLLAEWEYHGDRTYANSWEQNYQAQYAYYQAGNSKIKYKYNGTTHACCAFCRSVRANTQTFCCVATDGSATSISGNNSYGVTPGFCV